MSYVLVGLDIEDPEYEGKLTVLMSYQPPFSRQEIARPGSSGL